MEVFGKIEQALEGGKTAGVLEFGSFRIVNQIGAGGQGGVFELRNKIGKRFALKIHQQAGHALHVQRKSRRSFAEELKIMLSLRHRNIARMYSRGTAFWSDKDGRWVLSEGIFEESQGNSVLLYCIMEYIEGKDISLLFPELRMGKDKEPDTLLPLGERLHLFEELSTQISEGVTYCHSMGITHNDIKPHNIRFCSEDSTFVIVDFGFPRRAFPHQDSSVVGGTEYLDAGSIMAEDYKRNDIAQLAMVLLRILPSFRSKYEADSYHSLESALKRAIHINLEKRYQDIREFYDSLKEHFVTLPRWKFAVKLDECLGPNGFGRFVSKVRIPVSGSVLLTREVQRIVDSRDFQRLRGVRQLGPTAFVFPGASHTRFEHSLGTYFLSLRYLERLMKLSTFRTICEPVGESVKQTLLASLLHDIGHYPYSHWVEEIGEIPGVIKFTRHEDRAREMICDGELRQLLQTEWDVRPEIVADIIARRHIGGKEITINSIINSPVDVDKIDYLTRDSIHCGVDYGEGIDVERLLDSLYIDPDTKKICVTDKGRSCLLSILTCRNIMYQEVYWHKTVRVCDAMFKRFLYEYLQREFDSVETVRKYFEYSDDRFIGKLFARSERDRQLNSLIRPFAHQGRVLYKPAFIFCAATASREPIDTRNFFERLVLLPSYADLVEVSNTLADCLNECIRGLKPLDILLEKTPIGSEHEKYVLQDFRVWNLRKGMYESASRLDDSLNQYLENNIRVYIFCNPEYYKDLKELERKGTLNEILGEVAV